jgi:phage tail sheath gpL-like
LEIVMPVPFNNVPGNILVPFAWFEVNPGGTPFAGQSQQLLIGQKTSGGAAAAGVPYGPIAGPADAVAAFGLGSMLHLMFLIARANNPIEPIFALPLADPSGAAAAGTITITAPGVAGAGLIAVMGRLISVQVNAADLAATVAANLVAAINAANLPVTAAVDGTHTNQVDLTARHVGALGNNIDVAVVTNQPNVFNSANAVIVAMAGGSGVPSLTTALANCGDLPFDWIASPYADSTSLDAIKAFLNDQAGRWSPSQQIYGHHFTANVGNLSAQTTLGAARNNQHETIVGTQSARTPPWERAAAWAGVAASYLSTAPSCSQPLQTLPLANVLPPFDRTKWWAISDRQTLYGAGIAAENVNADGSVVIDRAVTTYKTNAANAPDATFRDVETMAQAMFSVRFLRSAVATAFPRAALADENPFGVQGVVTVTDIRNELIHAYNGLVALGVADHPELFAQYLQVQRNASDASRVDAYLPEFVIGQLRVFAGNLTLFQGTALPTAPLATA